MNVMNVMTRKILKYGGGATSEPDSPEPEARDDRTEEGEVTPQRGEGAPASDEQGP